MLKSLSIIFIAFSAIFFSACSSKKVYEPLHVKDDWQKSQSSNFEIKSIAPNIAHLEDSRVLADGKVLDIAIDEGNRLIGYSEGWVISSDIDGNVTLQHTHESKKVEKFSLKRTVAAASIKDDMLAVLFSNNEMALYSIATKTLLLKEQGDAPIVINSKVVPPLFRDDLVIFSTLDGKVVIINAKMKKKLRSVIVSSEEHFNNIIYLALADNKIIAATGHKILSLAQKEIRLPYDIRAVLAEGKEIFVATKQGEIISLTPDLQQNAKLKFPFAHFLGMVTSGDKLYVLEKEGYLLEIAKDLSEHAVYEVDLGEGYLFIHDKTFFVDDEAISVE